MKSQSQNLTVTTLRKAASGVGATVEQDAIGVYQVVAPEGKFWHDSNGPHLRVDFTNAVGRIDPELRQEELTRAIDRISFGLYAEDQ